MRGSADSTHRALRGQPRLRAAKPSFPARTRRTRTEATNESIYRRNGVLAPHRLSCEGSERMRRSPSGSSKIPCKSPTTEFTNPTGPLRPIRGTDWAPSVPHAILDGAPDGPQGLLVGEAKKGARGRDDGGTRLPREDRPRDGRQGRGGTREDRGTRTTVVVGIVRDELEHLPGWVVTLAGNLDADVQARIAELKQDANNSTPSSGR